jgi:hypothetical protein
MSNSIPYLAKTLTNVKLQNLSWHSPHKVQVRTETTCPDLHGTMRRNASLMEENDGLISGLEQFQY